MYMVYSLLDQVQNLAVCVHLCVFPVCCRWFDKSFSLIVTPSGNVAINFEHAWGDGVAVLRFFNEIHKETTTRPYISDGSVPAGMVPQVERLQFKLSSKIKERLSKAEEEFAKFTGSLKIEVLEYETFGKDLLKEQNITPDGVMQLAFQVCVVCVCTCVCV